MTFSNPAPAPEGLAARPAVLIPCDTFATRRVTDSAGEVVLGNAIVHASLVGNGEQLRAIAAHIEALADTLTEASGLVLPDNAGKILPGGRS